MRSPNGWIKTARRGSAYCTHGGHYWISKVQGKWVLLQMSNKSLDREQKVFGYFNTLTEAAAFYEGEIK
jgi:hypothetical protein